MRCAKQITVVMQANDRAAAAGRKAFVSVLGLGLGVWKLIPAQARIFLQVGLPPYVSSVCSRNIRNGGSQNAVVSIHIGIILSGSQGPRVKRGVIVYSPLFLQDFTLSSYPIRLSFRSLCMF